MNVYIGIEDLAANALIAVLAKGNRRFISYDDIRNYGNKVIEILNEKEPKAVLIMSGNNTDALFRNYSDFFEEREYEGKNGIFLREEKEVFDLIREFRGYLSIDVLLAFVNKSAVAVLGVSA